MSKEFFETIKLGNLEETQRLLSLTPSLIHEKENGLSSVMLAAYQRNVDMAEFLAEKKVNIDIFEAAAIGKLNRIMLMVARDPLAINAYSEDGFQPLGLACFFGHYETVKFLINTGASINSPSHNELSVTPLHSSTAGNYEKIVELLLDHEADPNARDQQGFTPLHIAAQNGNLQIIRLLLFNGANLALPNKNGKLPIDLANAAGHKQAAGLLKEGITRRFRIRQQKQALR
ncbi:MAG: hypothetical protein Fur002_18700 [Anaerolineales bacterium]